MTFKLLSAAAISLILASPAHAQPDAEEPIKEDFKYIEDEKAVWSLVWENDIFANSDANYTNGFRVAWSSAEATAPDWLRWSADWLPIADGGNKRISIAVGQNMYTPEDITLAVPNPNDRPYAGWTYASVGVVSDTGKTLDNVMLTLGVVGPASGAREVQDFVHDVINDRDPKGWDYQLDNEIGVNLNYERKWRSMYEASPYGTGIDITPHAGLSLGNVNTSAIAGATLRIGYDLPQDYGPPRIRPSLPGSDFFAPNKDIGGYFFLTAEGRAVARDIFLDGNTFQDSPSVDKEHFVGSLSAGVSMTFNDTRVSYTHVLLTPEFKEQDDWQTFGAVTVSHRF